MASVEKEAAFWLGVIYVDLRKEKGNFWKETIFITRQIRISGKCFNFGDAKKWSTVKIWIRDSLETEEFFKDRFM